MNDNTKMGESSQIGVGQVQHQPVQWRARWKVEKFEDTPSADVRAGTATPTEILEREGNLLVYGGADVMWLGLRGDLSTTWHFDNGNAIIAVGDSNTAAAASQTDLQTATTGASGRWYGTMEATYPTHTTGTGSTNVQDMTFRAIASTTEANFAWNEWAVMNATGGATQRMLNRKVESLGTKTTSATWTFTVTLSLS